MQEDSQIEVQTKRKTSKQDRQTKLDGYRQRENGRNRGREERMIGGESWGNKEGDGGDSKKNGVCVLVN